MQTFKLLSNDTVLLSQPQLVKHFGRAGAQLLSQLHYWLTKDDSLGLNHQGHRWIYNTADEWAKQLQLSARHVRRLVAELVEQGILKVEKLHKQKSIRTNYYSIDYDRLNDSIILSNVEPQAPDVKEIKDKMSVSPCQNVLISIHKLTNKNNINKSEKFEKKFEVAGQGVNQVEQVKNLNSNNKKDLGNAPLVAKTSTAQDMLKIWNENLSEKASAKLSKILAPQLVAAFKTKFESSLANWQSYCEMLKSSEYLMRDSFNLTISWALKFTTIDRIRAGDLGVKNAVGQGGVNSHVAFDDKQIRQMIEALPESDTSKKARFKIAEAIGAAAYHSWFHNAQFCDNAGKINLVAPNPFVEQTWETHFDWVMKA